MWITTTYLDTSCIHLKVALSLLQVYLMGFCYTWGAELIPPNEPKRFILFSYCPSLCCIYADNYLCWHLCVYLVELENVHLCMIHLWTWKCPSLYDLLMQTRCSTTVLHLILFKHYHVYVLSSYCSTNIQNGHDFYKHSSVRRADYCLLFSKICPDNVCVVIFLTFVLQTINFFCATLCKCFLCILSLSHCKLL